jgi:hypothetical protein
MPLGYIKEAMKISTLLEEWSNSWVLQSIIQGVYEDAGGS